MLRWRRGAWLVIPIVVVLVFFSLRERPAAAQRPDPAHYRAATAQCAERRREDDRWRD